MTVFRLNSSHTGFSIPDHPGQNALSALQSKLSNTSPNQPIILLVHGKDYSPVQNAYCPHQSIYAATSGDGGQHNWPSLLDPHSNIDPVIIAYGWHARPHPKRSIKKAYALASEESKRLAHLLISLSLVTDRKIDVVAHSYGAAAILRAIPALTRPILGRVIQIGAAEFGVVTLASLQTTAARAATFYNITSPGTDLFDFVFECIGPRPGPADRSLGMGFPFPYPNWVDIPVEDALTRARLRRFGIHTDGPGHSMIAKRLDQRWDVLALSTGLIAKHPGTDANKLRTALQSVSRRPRWITLLHKTVTPLLAGPRPVRGKSA